MYRDNDLFFSIGQDIPYLGGVCKSGFTLTRLYSWLFVLLPTFEAYMVGWFMGILISIAGFSLLGKELLSDYKAKCGTVAFCGFLYGLLPTFPSQTLGFASLPLLLYLMIKIYRTKRPIYMVLLFFYPVFSSLACFGVIACIFAFMFFIIDWIVKKKPSWIMLAATFVLGAGFIAMDWQMLYNMLFSGSASIRSSFESETASFFETLKTIVLSFGKGHVHSGALHSFVVLPVCGIFFLCLNVGFIKKKEYKKIIKEPYNWLMFWIVFNCIIYGLDNTWIFKKIISTVIPPLSGFSFARTLWFNPFLWYFSYMITLCRLKKNWLINSLKILAFIVLCVFPVTYNLIGNNLLILKSDVTGAETDRLTYHEFYSEDLFEDIKADIGYDGEWSVAFGMYPAVLQYNGIATLDGYLSKYPADYKEEFRKLIAPELEVDEENAEYFDNWGGRAYIFSDEVPYDAGKTVEVDEATMRIDPEVFREMGGEYVFSRVLVKNADDLGLDEIGVYTDDESPYTIYVYRAETVDRYE